MSGTFQKTKGERSMSDEEYDFSIKLTGKLTEIDVNTFLDTVGNIVIGLHQINDEVRPGKGLQITIKEIKPDGSMGFFFTLKHALIDKLPLLQYITKNDLETVSSLVLILVGLLTIRKLLKGEKAKEVTQEREMTTIINAQGDKIQIDNRTYDIFTENQVIDAALGKTFDTLEGDESVQGFELYESGKKKVFDLDRGEFSLLSKPAVMPEEDTRVKKEDAILTMFKVVFEKGYKWQFFYQGVKISADIKDETFFARIDKGEKFSKGDTIIAELHITQVYDRSIETYVNKEYVVAAIKQHMPRGSQTSWLTPSEDNNTFKR